jgi:hypothetical protein
LGAKLPRQRQPHHDAPPCLIISIGEKHRMSSSRLLAAVLFSAALFNSAAAQAHEPNAQHTGHQVVQSAEDHYAPYAFLIGDWNSEVAGAHAFSIRQTYSWGHDHADIQAAAYVLIPGREEDLHFEGIMTWNQAHQNLDFLFMHEPGTGGQEAGVIHTETDGSIVREITETTGTGVVRHSRQTWRRVNDNTLVTSMTHQNADGSWAPNFPGSDNLVMTRRPN